MAIIFGGLHSTVDGERLSNSYSNTFETNEIPNNTAIQDYKLYVQTLFKS